MREGWIYKTFRDYLDKVGVYIYGGGGGDWLDYNICTSTHINIKSNKT